MVPTVVLELANDHQLARDLVAGGVFIPDCTLAFNADCELIVRHEDHELRVPARVVWVDPGRGAGLQLICGPEVKKQIAELAGGLTAERVASVSLSPDATPVAVRPPIAAAARVSSTDAVAVADTAAVADAAAKAAAEADAPADPDPAADAEADAADAAADAKLTDAERKIALNVQDRLRGLSLAQQIKVAHKGEVTERIILERMYGKNVWEALLRNPRLTGQEVARIARMGALPRVLIEIIVNNGGWLQIPEVRRALLSNPRLATDQILRVLRLLPKHELKLAAIQTAYSFGVRDAARRMIKEE